VIELCQLDHPALAETVFDEYVPVTMTWPDYHKLLDAPLYVRYAGSGSLLELKFHPDSCRLVEAVLVAAPGLRREHGSLHPSATEAAVAACLSVQADRPSDSPVVLEVTAFDDCMLIAVEPTPPLSWAGSGPVLFGLDASRQVVALCVQWDSGQRGLVLTAG
jgi:hypothetical protein